jgi:hypothetical protein
MSTRFIDILSIHPKSRFEEPNFDLLRSLFFMIWYMLTFSDNQKDVGYAFSLLGLLVKLSQTVSFTAPSVFFFSHPAFQLDLRKLYGPLTRLNS